MTSSNNSFSSKFFEAIRLQRSTSHSSSQKNTLQRTGSRGGGSLFSKRINSNGLKESLKKDDSTSKESIIELCDRVKNLWSSSLPEEGWYLAVLASLVTFARFDECKQVVHHLIKMATTSNDATTGSESSLKKLTDRLMDMTMKQWTIIGIPLSVMALAQIAAAEKEAGIPVPSMVEQIKASHYYNQKDNVNDDSIDMNEIESRGCAAMQALYKHNLPPIMATWGMHQADMEWLEKRYIYGMFLSDTRILSAVETEIVVLASIMCQGLMAPSMWHVRGMRRIGVSLEDIECVCGVVKSVAEWSGKTGVSEWIQARDVIVDI